MHSQGKSWSDVTLVRDTAELIVCQRLRRTRLRAKAVELSVDVAGELWGLCDKALLSLARMQRRPYGGVPYAEPDEYLAVPATELPHPDHPVPAPESDDSLPDLEHFIATPGLPSVSREELHGSGYLCYAVICTDQDTGDRIGFAKQKDPHRIAKASPLKAILGQEGLQRLTDPLFVFDDDFDLVVAPEEIAILRLEAFNRMFADLHTIVAAVPVNARVIGDAVPGMPQLAVDTLVKAATARPSLARRLQRLAKSGAIPSVTPQKLAAAMTKHKLSPEDVVVKGEVSFSEDKAGVFLDLMEQLYYQTDFTREQRRADRYSPLA